jgi:hypothetical protein
MVAEAAICTVSGVSCLFSADPRLILATFCTGSTKLLIALRSIPPTIRRRAVERSLHAGRANHLIQ